MSNEGALANLDDNLALARIRSGELMKSIAGEYGVRKQSLRERLMKHPDYHQAIKEQAESIVEEAVQEAMDKELACDMPVIARARLRVDTAFKYAASRDPERWGQRTSVNVNIDLGSALQAMAERMQERTIEHDGATLGATPEDSKENT